MAAVERSMIVRVKINELYGEAARLLGKKGTEYRQDVYSTYIHTHTVAGLDLFVLRFESFHAMTRV